MKFLELNFRILALIALVFLALSLTPQYLLAQSISASPARLPFGVPTGTTFTVPPSTFPASSSEIVTVNIVGATPGTPITFSPSSVGPSSPPLTTDNPTDFVIDGDACAGNTFTSPNTCQISLHYNASLFNSDSPNELETAMLTINSNVGSPTVQLSGAYGAIKIFDETDVTETPFSIPFSTIYTIASKQLNLTCSANPITAMISGTPGTYPNSVVGPTLGYVLQDNYITLQTGPSLTPVSDPDSTPFPPGNVCGGTGAVADSNGSDFYADCFTSNYQEYAFGLTLPPPLGLDPDTFANPGNAVLTEQRPNTNNAGGVPAIDVSSFLTGPYPEAALFTLSTSAYEGVYDNSTLYLVTNCTAPGITPGGSVTLNPVNPNNPTSETQTAYLDNSPGQNISLTTSSTVANQETPGIVPTGTVMVVTDYEVPQQLFSQLVSGTSAAPSVCARMSGEKDQFNQPMCKGFLVQCYIPGAPGSAGILSGDNCISSSAISAKIYPLFALEFSSPDETAGYNFFTNLPWTANTIFNLGQTIVDQNGYVQQVTSATPPSTSGGTIPANFTDANATSDTPGTVTNDGYLMWTNEGPSACLNVGPGSTGTPGTACAPGTGPGLLVGSDNWLCPPGASLPCAPSSTLSTQTPTSPPTFAASNCVFTVGGLLSGDQCPIDILTAFADGKGPKKTNSVLIPVSNMPKPTGTVSISGQNASGWVNTPSTAMANFTADPASYGAGYPASGPNIPASNGFAQPSINNVTAGFSNWPSLPDTTYAILTDYTAYNTPAEAASPICPAGTPAGTFSPSASLTTINGGTVLADGIYNLHFFAEGCDFAEGLVFQPTPAQVLSATDNWASFPFETVGVDTVAPTVPSPCTQNPASPFPSGWYGSNVTVNCTVTDGDFNSNPEGGQPITGSGFAPPVNGIQGSVSEAVSASTSVAPNSVNAAAVTGPPSPAPCDQAGNCVAKGSIPSGPFQIDLQPPTVTGSAGISTVGGAAIAVTFTCNDGVGSGIQSCSATGTPGNFVQNTPFCSPSSREIVTCGGTIPTTTVESGNITVTGTDNVGNVTQLLIYYAVNPALWTITPSPYYFGEFSVGQTSPPQIFTVHNASPTAIAIKVSIPGNNVENPTPPGDPDDFRFVSNGCNKRLAAGASCNVTVVFISDSDNVNLPNGNYAYLTVSNSSGTVLVQTELTGLTVDPTASLSTNSYSFENQTTGVPITERVATLSNSGPTTLIIGNLSITGSKAFVMAGGDGSCSPGEQLAPDFGCQVYVTYTPTKKGITNTGGVKITSNAANSPESVSLSGTGN